MTRVRVYIAGMGLVSPIGHGLSQTKDSIKKAKKGIKPLSLFPTPQKEPLPVGEISESFEINDIPRTHKLALIAAKEAMADFEDIPDAVVIGVTTGGMAITEEHLRTGNRDPESFKYHSTGSVADYIAREYQCKGPVITISTACSSGTAAVKIALEMLRAGKAKKILVGGADSLCRLTYYGFNSLQLIDPDGARPLDRNRQGMSVGEGAAMMLLVADEDVPDNAIAEILGAGLSCDAYHPVAPHPEGEGALQAMLTAIKDADISPSDIDYVNLHGTGTLDND
ncbi:3-oxoacyl-ACP synthase, partial [Candidatus Bathyarchaeota archaeon]